MGRHTAGYTFEFAKKKKGKPKPCRAPLKKFTELAAMLNMTTPSLSGRIARMDDKPRPEFTLHTGKYYNVEKFLAWAHRNNILA